jgi:ubiquinone/menaquinone biosynthesis C-methylase UbiE
VSESGAKEKKNMESDKKHRICPVERAGILDFGFRNLLQNPGKMLGPYIKEGMTALDLGCGPGFFTVEMARLVGETGRVIAADLQPGMLEKAKKKLASSGFAARVNFHLCRSDRIALAEKCDFILVFYMLHEVPNQAGFLREIKSLLTPGGKVLLAEPKWHVTRSKFQDAIGVMKQAGFSIQEEPAIRFSRSIVIATQKPV